MYKICLVWLLLWWLLGKKTSKKKSIFSKFHETSKYHIFRKSIFSSCLKMFIDFFKGLTDISKSWNLNKKICNNHKLLCFEIQNNQKFQPFQKLQVLKILELRKHFCHIFVLNYSLLLLSLTNTEIASSRHRGKVKCCL